MNYQYKVIVSNKNIYREFLITSDMDSVKLGTAHGCEFRLNQSDYFDVIELEFQKREETWELLCGNTVYLSRGDMRKLLYTDLAHGDDILVHYAGTGEFVFEVRFMIDFEAVVPHFNWKVSLNHEKEYLIGTDNTCDIVICSTYSQDSRIELERRTNGWYLIEKKSSIGVYHNGRRILTQEKLSDYDFFSIEEFTFFYLNEEIYFDKKGIESSKNAKEVETQTSGFAYPLFNRSTRLKCHISEESIDILVPPAVPNKSEENLVMTLLPALIMLVLTVVVRGFMANTSNSSFIIFSVCSMSLGIFTSIATFFKTRSKYKKDCAERLEQYTSYIDSKKEEISRKRQEELENLKGIYHDIDYDISVVDNFSSELFDRVKQDEDFLKVFAGVGNVYSKQQVDYKEKEAFEVSDELVEIPMQIVKMFEYIENAPVTMDFKTSNAIGIIGDKLDNYSYIKNIIIDIIVRQYYGEVNIVLLLEDNYEKYDWARYIPHLYNIQKTRNLVYDNESKNAIFEFLYKELSIRKESKDNSQKEYLIILVVNERGLKNHPLSQFIECATSLNVTFVFFEQAHENLPICCDEIVELMDRDTGLIYKAKDRNQKTKFSYQEISDETMLRICQKLAPVYCEEISLENALTKNISLYELLHIYSSEDIDLEEQWKTSQIYNSMAAPLGVNSKDEVIYLNLHEKAHGPHGLVAGTTGSGKSEILQTFILTASTMFHPYEISFVIIDFKGGGMVNQFKELPHLIGAITNIDGREIERSLKSIKAELLKRQTLFADANVNHIDKYIKLFKEGKVQTALPHLIIIVDEFAELKAEQPEFMKELISAARIGRSLGVHLILATQKPAGQVNEQIWSNSKFKLCLKVQNKEDSNEVLKSPLAAEIKEPGRAYLQVGNNEIFELFQSAYSGAPEKREDGMQKEFVISSVEYGGKRKTVFAQKKNESGKNNRTQLEAVVTYIHDYCERNNIERLPSICVPPLTECVVSTQSSQDYSIRSIPIGIYDDPDSQYQGEARFNFCDENTMIIGSSATGKTNLLQTIIRQVANKFSPKDANIYILDFGAMYLKNYEQLHHVGGVVTISDEEKLRNLFKLLLEEIQIRKAKFLEMGISSFSAYREAGYTEFPQIFLMIDNFTAFKEVYAESQEDNFLYITREGLTCGISVIVANPQTSGLGYKYLSNFACRIAFHCNDSGEYSTLFERCRLKPKEVPGRVLCKLNKDLFEMQTYLAFEGEKEIERSRAIKEFVEEMNAKYDLAQARRIPEIPDVLTYEFIEENYHFKKSSRIYPMALDYATVDLVTINFKLINELCIVGNDPDIRLKTLYSLFHVMEHCLDFAPIKTYIIDNVERPLQKRFNKTYVEDYTIEVERIAEILELIETEFAQRYDALLNNGMDAVERLPLYLVVINNRDVIDYICANKNILEIYNKILKQYKSLGICFLYTDIEDAPIAYGASEIMKRFKESKKALLTTKNLKEVKCCDIPASVIRSVKELKMGDVYFLNGSNVQRIKLL